MTPATPTVESNAPVAALKRAADAATRAAPGWPRMLLLVSLVVGTLLRVFQFAGNRSLWLDEALTARNVLERGWAGMLVQLGGEQVAAPGFLLTLKALATVLGSSELILRLPALAGGVAALLLFPRAAARWLRPAGVAWGTALLAVLPHAVYFASEVKPYSLDLLAGVAALLLAPVTDARGRRPGVWPFVGMAACAVWFSFPAVFVLAAVAGAAVLEQGGMRERMRAALPHLAWAASFVVVYLLTRSGQTDYMKAWWDSGFAPLPPTTLRDLAWYPETLLRLFRDPMGRYDSAPGGQLWQPAAALAAAGVGAFALLRARSRLLLVGAVLAAALLTASALKLFPLGADRPGGGRVLLFLAAPVALLVGAGLEWLGARRRGLPLAAAAGLLILFPLLRGVVSMTPHGRVEIRPLVQYLAQHRRPGDRIYVYYQAVPAFRYYAQRYGIRDDEWTPGRCERLTPRRYIDDIRQMEGQPRVWTVFTGLGTGARDFPERVLILRYIGGMGKLTDWLYSTLGELYLFDFTAPPMNPNPDVSFPPFEAGPESGCGPFAA